MTLESDLQTRAESKCELCSVTDTLGVYSIPPDSDGRVDQSAWLCTSCSSQIDQSAPVDFNHWRCLNDSMWSQVPAVQVLAWRMLTRMSGETWARDLLDMLFLEDEVLAWAQAVDDPGETESNAVVHLDSNGSKLEVGDAVTLIKDLNVKGGGFTAKRGTAVRGIALVPDNPEHIEGRINGQKIVILTKFVKK
jgi:protein PhnA